MNYATAGLRAGDTPNVFDIDALRLEAVTTCVGFDDLLDITLGYNHAQVDTFIVVTSHSDWRTQKVAAKHGAVCVQTDLFEKGGRNFNKGAAINAGFDYFQHYGWRMHLDCDMLLADNFRRMLFNYAELDPQCIYGCDRVEIVGEDEMDKIRKVFNSEPQHTGGFMIGPPAGGILGSRYVDGLRGYVPIGFFQLWNARAHKSYPYSLGTAAHDDVMFGALWPRGQRRVLPVALCYHLCFRRSSRGENWDGVRRQPRSDR